ncbi:MAG: hypothetical protein QNJ40_14100 [Xanthomonadales bacterium]|nr:hypothetical protein [Xanthomonadales bacterium]
MTKVKKYKKLLLGLMVLAASGCAVTPQGPQSPEDRAKAKWDAIVVGDYAGAYVYYSPGYREAVSEEQFVATMSRRTLALTDALIHQTKDCDDEVCTVGISVGFRITTGVSGISRENPFESRQIVWEDWIRTEKGWFFVPER